MMGLYHEGPQPRRRRAIHLFWAVPLLVVVGVIISDLFGWAYLRVPAAKIATSVLGREVKIGKPFELHLRRTIRLSLGSFEVAAPAWSEEPHFVQLQGLGVELGWGAVVGRPPHVHDLRLDDGDIRAERNREGKASWQFGDQPPTDDANSAAVPVIDRIRIGQLQLSIDDAIQALDIDAVARTSEGAGGHADLQVSGEGTWQDKPVAVEVMAPHVLDVADRGAVDALEATVTLGASKVGFRGSIANLLAADGISGEVDAAGASLGDLALVPGLTLPSTPRFRIDGRIERHGQKVKATITKATIGSSALAGELVFDSSTTPPFLQGRLDAKKLVLQDLGPAIGSEGETAKSEAAKSEAAKSEAAKSEAAKSERGRVLPDRAFDLPSLTQMDADVAIDLKELDLGTDALRPLRSLKAHLTLKNGVLKLSDLESTLAGGVVTGATVFDASREDGAPAWEADLDWRRIDLRSWLKSAGENFFVGGKFSGKTKLKGKGQSTATILDSLDGSIKGRIDGGTISHLILELSGLDIAQALGVFVSGSEALPLSCALIDVTARRGTLESNLILLNTRDSVLFIDGSVNLTNEKLGLRIVPAPKDWSPLSLRTPITVGGTFGDPAIGIDPVPIALKALSAVVLGAITPIAALLPLVDLGSSDAKEGCDPAIKMVREKTKDLGGPFKSVPGSKDAAEATDEPSKLKSSRLPGGRP